MLCGGVTVYSPLTQYRAGQEGVKDVGIVGIGGLVSCFFFVQPGLAELTRQGWDTALAVA